MVVKRLSAVRVTNPLSDIHMVDIHPNQPFVLELSKWMGVQEVDWDSEFFTLSHTYHDDDGSEFYIFEPTADLSDWTKYSNTYLGEVTLIAKDVCTTLCVVLLSENPYVLTLINPWTCEIKVQAHQILEFVFWGNHAEVAAKTRGVSSGHLGLLYREHGNEDIIPGSIVSDINVALGDFVIRQRNTEQREWHYWYRLSDELICRANSLPNAIYNGGKISFGSDEKRNIHISISVKKREPKKPREPQIIVVPGTTGTPTTTKLPKLTKQNFYYAKNQYQEYWREPNVAEVELSYKGEVPLTDGCRVIDLDQLKRYIKDEKLKESEYLNPHHPRLIYDYD